MKQIKNLLVSLIAVFAVISLLGCASAAFNVAIDKVEINDKVLDGVAVAAFAGDTLPVQVFYTSYSDVADAKVKAWISGYQDDIEAVSERVHLLAGTSYVNTLSLKIPSDLDLSEDHVLYVRVEDSTGFVEKHYTLRTQRESYTAELIEVSGSDSVTAGSDLQITLVLKNTGYEKLDDLKVNAKILETNTAVEAYLGDLVSVDSSTRDDAVEKLVTLRIPSNLDSGIYTLDVKVSNADVSTEAVKKITVSGTKDTTRVLITGKNQIFASGKTGTWNFEVINLGKETRVYEIAPETNEKFAVKADPSTIVVKEGESKTFTIQATSNEEGIYNFGVRVMSDGKLVEKVLLSAKVQGGFFDSNTVLAIALAIVFAVLLIVLIVLLTRKPKKTDELEESYY
jgi:uncharacterized membrane protein